MSEPRDPSVRVFRFDPSSDEAPRYESYVVPYERQMRVLDVLEGIVEKYDVSLAYRWFCGVKKCGVCGVTVNGRPMLSCWEPATQSMVIEPLVNFPIIRDLVVDTESYEKIVQAMKPLVVRDHVPRFPERISHDRMVAAYRLMPCIQCYVCSAAVPVRGVEPEGIAWEGNAGPTAIVRLARCALDPRDTLDRRQIALNAGLPELPAYPELEHICPNGIKINSDALLPLRKKFSSSTAEPRTPKSDTVFIRAKQWSAFVRLTAEAKDGLISSKRLAAEEIPGIKEAYRLLGDARH